MIRYLDITFKHADGTHMRFQHYNEDDAFLVTLQDENLKTIDRVGVSEKQFKRMINNHLYTGES